MSLRYHLLGIPATIGEVMEKSEKTGEVPEIYMSGTEIGARLGRYKVAAHKIKGESADSVFGLAKALANYIKCEGIDVKFCEDC